MHSFPEIRGTYANADFREGTIKVVKAASSRSLISSLRLKSRSVEALRDRNTLARAHAPQVKFATGSVGGKEAAGKTREGGNGNISFTPHDKAKFPPKMSLRPNEGSILLETFRPFFLSAICSGPPNALKEGTHKVDPSDVSKVRFT